MKKEQLYKLSEREVKDLFLDGKISLEEKSNYDQYKLNQEFGFSCNSKDRFNNDFFGDMESNIDSIRARIQNDDFEDSSNFVNNTLNQHMEQQRLFEEQNRQQEEIRQINHINNMMMFGMM